MFFGVGVSFRIMYSIVSYFYVSCSGSIISVGEVCYRLLVIMWFLCLGLGWAALLHCGICWLFNIACVQGSTNGTNGIPISFKVLPMVPLVKPLVPMVMAMVPLALLMVPMVPLVSQWYHWLPMIKHGTIGKPRTEP